MLQSRINFDAVFKRGLKPVSLVFIVAELLDITTTYGGLAWMPQLWEANPLPGLLGEMGQAMGFKLLATLAVVIVLEKVEHWPRLVWIVPVAAGMPVLWNLLAISAEFMNAYSTYITTFLGMGGVR